MSIKIISLSSICYTLLFFFPLTLFELQNFIHKPPKNIYCPNDCIFTLPLHFCLLLLDVFLLLLSVFRHISLPSSYISRNSGYFSINSMISFLYFYFADFLGRWNELVIPGRNRRSCETHSEIYQNKYDILYKITFI